MNRPLDDGFVVFSIILAEQTNIDMKVFNAWQWENYPRLVADLNAEKVPKDEVPGWYRIRFLAESGMGDMGEYFNDLRKFRQEKRSENREHSAKILRQSGIPFVECNRGAHLIVANRYDFWPGTGLWIDRQTKTKRRGVRNLVAVIRAEKELQS